MANEEKFSFTANEFAIFDLEGEQRAVSLSELDEVAPEIGEKIRRAIFNNTLAKYSLPEDTEEKSKDTILYLVDSEDFQIPLAHIRNAISQIDISKDAQYLEEGELNEMEYFGYRATDYYVEKGEEDFIKMILYTEGLDYELSEYRINGLKRLYISTKTEISNSKLHSTIEQKKETMKQEYGQLIFFSEYRDRIKSEISNGYVPFIFINNEEIERATQILESFGTIEEEVSDYKHEVPAIDYHFEEFETDGNQLLLYIKESDITDVGSEILAAFSEINKSCTAVDWDEVKSYFEEDGFMSDTLKTGNETIDPDSISTEDVGT